MAKLWHLCENKMDGLHMEGATREREVARAERCVCRGGVRQMWSKGYGKPQAKSEGELCSIWAIMKKMNG